MYYGWWLVGVTIIVMILANVLLFFGMTAWFPVLENRFGWGRAQLALAFSLTRVEGSITGPVSGHLIDKLGPRLLVFCGLVILGGGFLFFSRIQNLWQFYLAFLIMSTGMGVGGWLAMMTVLNSWFVRRRTAAMSMGMAGQAAGGVLLVPALAWSIDPDQFGPDRWRVVAMGIGVVILILAMPIARLVRNRPEDYGLRPDGDPPLQELAVAQRTESPRPTTDEPSFTLQEAIRTREFWLISLGHACTAAASVTVIVHIGSIFFHDRGFALQTVGLVVASYMGIGVVFSLVGGYIGDRVSIRLATFGFSIIQSVAIIVLLLAHNVPMAFLFAILLGIGMGGRGPLTTAIRGVYFGRKSFASITGISMLPMNVLTFALPYFAGQMFDIYGQYDVAFGVVAAVSFIGAGLFLILGEPQPQPSPRPAAQASAKAKSVDSS